MSKGFRILNHVNAVTIERFTELPALEKLPAGIYTLDTPDKEGRLVFARRDTPFNVPSKLYGDHNRRKDIILRALSTREQSVGALLLGLKGTGKTVLAHDLCNTAVEQGYPVFVVSSYIPAELLRFVYNLVKGECVFLFDEFSTYYSDDSERKQLLTFFSDRAITKALFLVMQNDTKELPDAFINRTGRFLFRFDYTWLTRTEAAEIIEDYLMDDQKTRDVLLDYCDQQEMTPDTLISLLEQLKYFDVQKDLAYLLQTLNIPRPVFVNLEMGVGFDAEYPLPDGFKLDVVRSNAGTYLVKFVNEAGATYEATSIDVGQPAVGRGGSKTMHHQYESDLLGGLVKVYYQLKTLSVPTLDQYIPPQIRHIEYVAEKANTER